MYKFKHNRSQFLWKDDLRVYFCKLGGDITLFADRVEIYKDSACKEIIEQPVRVDSLGRLTNQIFTKEPHSYAVVGTLNHIYATDTGN